MESKYQQLILELGKEKVFFQVDLSPYSSFHLGGKAKVFFRAETKEELFKAVISARKFNIPYFVIGGGTNLLISEKGFPGLVIKNETRGIKIKGVSGGKEKQDGNYSFIHVVYLEVESGVSVNHLVRFTLEQGLAGLEAFLGLPGTVGGAIFMNAHNLKTGNFFGHLLHQAKIVDSSGEIKEVPQSYFQFDYDKSIIQKTKEVILSAVLKLKKENPQNLWKKAQESLDYRRKTQPWGCFSSGCVFRNISESEALRIASPQFTCSAGFLLESVGLKGKKIGGTRFSEKHANFIVHQGKGKVEEVISLINLAKKLVKEKYKIELKEEIVFMGKF